MDRNKTIAVIITVLIAVLILLWLFMARLSWKPQVWPPEPDPYIAMLSVDEEEFIEVDLMPRMTPGDNAAPAFTPEDLNNESQPGPQTGNNTSTQGPKADPTPQQTQQHESPVKTNPKPNPEKPGASTENNNPEQEARSQQTRNEMANAFAQTQNRGNAQNGRQDTGNAGTTQGNPSSAAGPAATGTGEGIVTGGWKMPTYSRKIPSTEVGEVKFTVEVKKDGSIGTITHGTTRLSPQTIAACEAEIRKHNFTHSNPAKAESATAYITFKFVNPKQ